MRFFLNDAAFDFSGVRVLVADDNTVNQELIVELLSEAGAVVDVASNGKEAMEKVLGAVLPYNIVLMDIQMPIMDGYEATRKIREDLRFSKLPIIALTGNALSDELQHTKNAGMSSFLPKPYTLQILFETVQFHIDA